MHNSQNQTQTQTQIAQLVIWTRKFAEPLLRINQTSLQKITATDNGELIFSVYKPHDDRSLVVLSIKKGASGISLTKTKPITLKQPNSFVQMARKYAQNRKIVAAYATMSPICLVFEFGPAPDNFENAKEINDGPNAIILDLDSKPPRLMLVKKTKGVPSRYQSECGKNFTTQEDFFESWCEWSEQNTKTKKREGFLFPMVGYCPLFKTNLTTIAQNKSALETSVTLQQENNIISLKDALNLLPGHIRRAARTKLQFFERRLQKQNYDFPTNEKISSLKKQGEELKNNLYLLPVQNGEKPSSALKKLFHEIHVLERRQVELTKRIAESKKALESFQNLIFLSANKDINALEKLCKIMKIEIIESEQIKKLKIEKQERLPYRSFVSSTGQFIRVARSAADGEKMLKLMPSNHYWCHVLNGEGSHVWLEKAKGEKKLSPVALKEAAMLAVHYSKQSRSQNADVQYTIRADIEKKKNLPVGKVLVRRCQTLNIRYTYDELKNLIEE